MKKNRMAKPFIRTDKDIKKLCIGDRIFSESKRRYILISKIHDDLSISGTVEEGEKKLFNIKQSKEIIFGDNYRYPDRIYLHNKGSVCCGASIDDRGLCTECREHA